MPGWHARTQELVAGGQLLVAGIAPEQHGDRMALFLQWKQMEAMPVMVDSFNIFNLKAVPTTLLIDESGVIRHRNPSEDDLTAFMALPPVGIGTAPTAPRLDDGLLGIVPAATPPWNLPLETLEMQLTDIDAPKWLAADFHFQLGVAFRKRYDSADRKPDDFATAVKHWRKALSLDPTNYIWRRRLQQYGPLLDKPYPFYGWIAQARKDIAARGDTPHSLVVEPGAAELANPDGIPKTAADLPPHPDPEGKLPRDGHHLMLATSTVVPHTKQPRSALRLFIEVIPQADRQAKWNDEAGPSTVHIRAPQGWTARPMAMVLQPATKNPVTAPRRVEFELRRDKNVAVDTLAPFATVEVYSQVCSGANNTCTLSRTGTEVPLLP